VLVLAVTLAGCASTRQERAAAFQRELPELVAACNGWIDPNSLHDERSDGFEACSRLAVKKSLGLADPVAASAYIRSRGGRIGPTTPLSAPYAVPMPLPQVQ
jgi:hypothetical protein